MNATHALSPEADPRDRLAHCESAVAADRWFEAAGIEPRWPLSSEQAARLLSRGGEYEVTAARLEDLIERRLIPAPSLGETGVLEWSAEDLATATGTLEGRSQWWPAPSKHDPKKHPCRLILEQARESGTLETLAHGGPVRFDVKHLLALLTACPNHEGRIKIGCLLEAVLEVDCGVQL